MTQLNAAASVAHDGHSITEWKCKSFKARLRFLLTGKIKSVEKGLTSNMTLIIGDTKAIIDRL